jgi:hypothetical protein
LENNYKLGLHKSGFHSINNKYKCDSIECNFETNYYHLFKEHQFNDSKTNKRFFYIINDPKNESIIDNNINSVENMFQSQELIPKKIAVNESKKSIFKYFS